MVDKVRFFFIFFYNLNILDNGYGCTSQMGNQMSGDYSNSDYGNNCGGMDGCCLKKRRRRSFEQLCNLLAFNNID